MLLQAPAPAKALPSGWSIFVPIESERKLYLLILTVFLTRTGFCPGSHVRGRLSPGNALEDTRCAFTRGGNLVGIGWRRRFPQRLKWAVTRKSNVAVFAIGKLPLRHYALTESWTLARKGVIAALVDYARGLCDAVLRSVHGEIRGY
jgi:hypothetical protein